MADSTRQLLLDKVKTLLSSITVSAGYGTQPKICEDGVEAWNAQERFLLWITIGKETVRSTEILGKFQVALEVQVNGCVRRGTDDMLTEANLMLQDVRNAIGAYRASFATACNGASFESYDSVDTDEGELAADDRAYWMLPLVFVYVAGPTW